MSELTQLANNVLTAREEKAIIEASLKEKNSEVRAAEYALISALHEKDIDGFKSHGVSFSTYSKLVATKTNEDQLFNWLESSGFGSVVKRTVHYATLNKICSEELEEHGELPAGTEVEFIDMLSVRKA